MTSSLVLPYMNQCFFFPKFTCLSVSLNSAYHRDTSKCRIYLFPLQIQRKLRRILFDILPYLTFVYVLKINNNGVGGFYNLFSEMTS